MTTENIENAENTENIDELGLSDRGVGAQAAGFVVVGCISVAILRLLSDSDHALYHWFEVAATQLYWAFVVPLAALFDWGRIMFAKGKAIREAKKREILAKATQEGLEQGIQQGLERGLEQGIQQGIQRGIERGLEQGLERGIERGLERGLEQGRQQGLEQSNAKWRALAEKYGIPESEMPFTDDDA